jgi:RNA polymerase sigma-70 factor, ECF subfamily
VVKRILEEQFVQYIKQYEKLIFTICFSFTKNYFDAENLAQETFLSAYKNIDKFAGDNLKAWLTTIAANKCKDYLKSPGRNIDNLTEEDYEYLEDNRGSPEEIVIGIHADERVRSLCIKLKEPYKTVAINYFCNGLKLSDIARETKQSLKTLQTQLYRAKKLLKALWKEEFI